MAAQPVRFRVVPQEDGMMIAQLLTRRLPGTRIELARELVKAGAVYLGHLRVRIPTVRVATGERISVFPGAADDEELPLELVKFVLREDDFVVLDKPAGVPVAATRESARGTLAEALRRRLESEGVLRPYVGVLHRLDRGASGLVLFTTRSVANKNLHRQFSEHDITRAYRMLVLGDAPVREHCELPVLELRSGTSKVAPGNRHARDARTDFARLEPKHPQAGTSLLEATLTTGRHHQIRVHAAALGHPIVGDRRYGRPDDGATGLHLHAWRLRFAHPHTGAAVEVCTELPAWAEDTRA